uniref:Uncharacterized protein n=1 Tax=Kalanchoe fedtschenkoi TaxID=63787 RepID=A0A7N0ZW94_KALFE
MDDECRERHPEQQTMGERLGRRLPEKKWEDAEKVRDSNGADTRIGGEPIINLPPKSIQLSKVDFSPDERLFYSKLEAESRSQFKKYVVARNCEPELCKHFIVAFEAATSL